MRVALVLDRFPVASEPFLVAKFLGLAERGVDIHVLCRSFNSTDAALFPSLAGTPDLRARIHTYGRGGSPTQALTASLRTVRERPGSVAKAAARAMARGGLPLKQEVVITALVQAVDELEIDRVHFGFGVLARMASVVRSATSARVSTSFRGFDLNFVGLSDPSFYDTVWKSCDRVHFVSNAMRERALWRGMPLDLPSMIIPPAVDWKFFDTHRQPAADPAFTILSIGRLHWKKGYEFGLAAVAAVRDRGIDLRYRVVGSGPHEQAVHAAVADFDLGDFVAFLGRLDRFAIREELIDSDVLLHPAISEGSGNVTLEAMAMRTPVVCTDADGLDEQIADGERGFVVRRRDTEAMADRLTELARDPVLRQDFGSAGRAFVLTARRPDQQINQWEAFLLAEHWA